MPGRDGTGWDGTAMATGLTQDGKMTGIFSAPIAQISLCFGSER